SQPSLTFPFCPFLLLLLPPTPFPLRFSTLPNNFTYIYIRNQKDQFSLNPYPIPLLRIRLLRMKIRCDVCDGTEASVYCTADEAALCDACDRRVHHANKLAGKHQRFSLLHPSFQDSPLCDICQVEKRAFLFCHEDRAILCRECDIPIHSANEHTQNHSRFLLTGVKLSSFSAHYDPTAAAAKINATTAGSSCCRSSSPQSQASQPAVTYSNNKSSSNKRGVEWDQGVSPVSYSVDESAHVSYSGDTTGSSISEYLDTLPGWRFDDFLLDPTATNGGGGGSDFWTTPYV
ncbi:B-box zinc finger protein 21, partial [Linum perenne]